MTTKVMNNSQCVTTMYTQTIKHDLVIKLSPMQIETIEAMATCKNMEPAAGKLCISVDALKSRLAKIREATGTRNLIDLMYLAGKLGI